VLDENRTILPGGHSFPVVFSCNI